MQDFVPRLKDHILSRLLNRDYNGDEVPFSDADRNTVQIIDNRVYASKVLRVNYMTYDLRWDQDSMNLRTHCDVMVMSRDAGPNAHPYWYARVLGVFHIRVLHTGPAATNRSVQHLEFLWVQWFGTVNGHRSGFKVARLPKIGFIEEEDDLAFGFLDPSLVLRGCHLIPAFVHGRTSGLLKTPHTAARPPGEFVRSIFTVSSTLLIGVPALWTVTCSCDTLAVESATMLHNSATRWMCSGQMQWILMLKQRVSRLMRTAL